MLKVLDKNGETITVYDAKEKNNTVYFLVYDKTEAKFMYKNANLFFPLYN